MKMTIEVVDCRKIHGDGSLKAFADIKFCDAIIVKGFSVIKGTKGIYVTMPRKACKDGRWFDVLTPLNDEMKLEIETKVLEAYDKETE